MPGMVFKHTKRGEITVLDEVLVDGGIHSDFGFNNIINFQPIPITPEILKEWIGWKDESTELAFYFTKKRGQYKRRWWIWEYKSNYPGGFWAFGMKPVPNDIFGRPKYVHQLQLLLAGLGVDHTAKIGGQDGR